MKKNANKENGRRPVKRAQAGGKPKKSDQDSDGIPLDTEQQKADCVKGKSLGVFRVFWANLCKTFALLSIVLEKINNWLSGLLS